MTSRSRQPRHGFARSMLFGLVIAAVFFGLVELVLALTGVRPRAQSEDPYVGFSSYAPLFVERVAGAGTTVRTTAPNKLRFFNDQSFPAHKDSTAYRIFCLGGSTTYGRPYDDKTSFCGWLRVFLNEIDPSRRWEVINAGGISYASYRVAAVMDELADYQPDLFIVYSGHNEFLEQRTYAGLIERPRMVRDLESLLNRTRLYSVLHRATNSLRTASGAQPVLGGEVNTVLDTIGPDAYTRDDVLARQVVEHYQFNLTRMVTIARDAGASLVLVTPASSLKDCKPFKSEPSAGLDAERSAQWRDHFERGRSLQLVKDWAGAVVEFRAAAEIDPRHAETQYRLGEVLLATGRDEDARQSFSRAIDEDVCPLRAISPLIDALRRVARDHNVPLVDYVSIIARRMRAEWQHDIAGAEYFLDHVHPTIEGHRVLALALLEHMAEHGVIDRGRIHPAAIDRVTQRINAAIDQRDHAVALRNLAKVLSWAGKTEDAARLAARALDALPEDAESLFILAADAGERGDWTAAVELYRRVVQTDPLYIKAYTNLGIAYVKQGDVERAIQSYNQALALQPDYGNAHYNVANAYARQGKDRLAIHHLRRAVELSPNDVDARYNLGKALARTGRTEEAIAEYQRLLEIAPLDQDARRSLERLSQTRIGSTP